jgi:4-diphosphocytidyl-2-C-methyl-D-erythritol kinase
VLSVIAPAKVNLLLAVGALRPDGYHDVTTVLHALELHDTVWIEPAEALDVVCDVDLGVPSAENLAHRAAVAMERAFGRAAAFRISVEKRIPAGAGLGGGSSDAAAVVAGIAHSWGMSPRDERCVAVAAEIGADVPFFLVPGGCALMTGRGDVLEREVPGIEGVPVVVVKPDEPVSTAGAYREFDEQSVAQGDAARLLAALVAGDADAVAASISNNMESASFRVTPVVADVLGRVKAQPGIRAAMVAGSGSAVFGLCDDGAAASRVSEAARRLGWWSVPTALRTQGVSITDAEDA